MDPWEMDWGGSQQASQNPWEMDWGGQPTTPSIKDRAKALAAGVNRGALNLAGMPVDTALNLVDLAKAGYGSVGGALGMPASSMPELTNRGNVPMSSEWLAQKAASLGAGDAIQNPNPQDALSRYAYAGGQAAAPIMFGGGGSAGLASSVRNVSAGGLGNMAGQAADDAGLPPSAQLLASMAVPAAVTGVTRGAQIKQDRAEQAKIDNSVRDQVIADAQKAGYVIPPMNVNPQHPGLTNRVISAIGLKVPLEQEASIKNTSVTDRLAKQYVGLPPDEPITTDSLSSIRANAGQAYDAVKQTGTIPVDGQYIRDITAVNNQYLKGASGNRTLSSKDAEMAIADAAKPTISGDQAVYLVRKLREAGFKNIKADDVVKNTTGDVQRGLSQALDDLIGRHLQANGTPQQYRDYLEARQTIAKAHTIEDALNQAGHVDARKLATMLDKGIPLSGEALQIAKAASVVPQGMQQVTSANPGLGTLLGWGGLGAAGTVATGNPTWLAAQLIPAIRPAARKIALSGPYQRSIAKPSDYKASLSARLLPELFPQDMGGLLGAFAVPPRE
jgi:hypothetical protein